MSDPLYLDGGGHRTWLKWHRGRRKASDPVFTGSRILEAMRLGASVEVDLVIHADHGCAILHNFSLEEETTGSGLVRETPAEDLCALLAQNQPHPDALLQLDFKEDSAALTPEVIANFGATVGPVARSLILSGGDFNAISLLANSAPNLRTGYDPCYGESLARLKATGDFKTFIDEALKTAPDAEMIYLAYDIVLEADAAGFDIVAPIHAAGRRIDAWTIRTVDDTTLPKVRRLLALKVDQITTDDPEGLKAALEK